MEANRNQDSMRVGRLPWSRFRCADWPRRFLRGGPSNGSDLGCAGGTRRIGKLGPAQLGPALFGGGAGV